MVDAKPHFRDRRDELFGREAALQDLLGRASTPGATAVVGRPLSGKTWLLQELGRRLSEGSRGALVGYYESGGDAPDILLRCISDLYTHWLRTASLNKQLKTVLDRHRASFVGTVGSIVGGLVKTVSRLGMPVVSNVAMAVEQGLNALVSLDAERQGGGLSLKPLTYDQARELIEILVQVNDRDVVLILDSWEKAPRLEMQKDLLDKYLHHPEEWPRTHVFLGIRREKESDAALGALSELELNPGLTIHELGPMVLDDAERGRLLGHIRQHFPMTENVKDKKLLELVAGHAGVLYRWHTGRPADADQLEALARDAQYHRYPELRDALGKLSSAECRVAARMALLPQISDAFGWGAMEEFILGGDDISRVGELEIRGVLAGEADCPSYGHPTRHEAALAWFTKDPHGMRYGRQEAGPLIECLHQEVRRAETDTEKYRVAGIVARTFQNVGPLKLRGDVSMVGRAAVAVTEARADLWGRFGRWLADLFVVESAKGTAEQTVVALLGTFESVPFASDSDVKSMCAEIARLVVHIAEHWNPEERDSMLAAIEEGVSEMSLTSVTGEWSGFVAASQDTDPRTWAAGQLARMHALTKRYPGSSDLRWLLAAMMALALPRAVDTDSLAARDAVLVDLSSRTPQDPEDTAFREGLQVALKIAMEDAVEATDLAGASSRRDLLQSLSEIYNRYPEYALVPYAELLSTFLEEAADAPDSRSRRDALLSELRALASQHPHSDAERLWAEAELFH